VLADVEASVLALERLLLASTGSCPERAPVRAAPFADGGAQVSGRGRAGKWGTGRRMGWASAVVLVAAAGAAVGIVAARR